MLKCYLNGRYFDIVFKATTTQNIMMLNGGSNKKWNDILNDWKLKLESLLNMNIWRTSVCMNHKNTQLWPHNFSLFLNILSAIESRLCVIFVVHLYKFINKTVCFGYSLFDNNVKTCRVFPMTKGWALS